MNPLKISVRLESLRLPLRAAMAEAQRFGVEGARFDARGDLAPDRLSQTGRRELLHLLRGHNLSVAALGCPLRHGLDVEQDQQPRLEQVQKVMALSYELGARVVLLEAGPVPADDSLASARRLTEALTVLGQHGDRIGTVLALATGLNDGATLRKYLDRFDTAGLAVALDPANWLMNGFDPYESGQALHGKVALAVARDARTALANRQGQEVALGHGDLDWLKWLALLEEIEYRGWITVEREGGDQTAADVGAGVDFLRRIGV